MKLDFKEIGFKISTGKPRGERPRGKTRYRWEENITMDVREIGIIILIDNLQERYP